MNFSPHSSNFNSASQQQSQQHTINTFNNGTYYQNLVPTFTGYPYYGNNYQYSQLNYNPQQGCNFPQSSFYNYPPKSTETILQGPKREYKPLVVFDPQRNEQIDLVEASKTTKSNSLVYEIKHESSGSKVSVSLNTVLAYDKDQTESVPQKEQNVTYQNEHKESDDDDHEETEEEDPEISNHDDTDDPIVSDDEDYKRSINDDTDETDHLNESSLPSDNYTKDSSSTMKYSQSIPNNIGSLSNSIDNIQTLEMSSSENNLLDKTISDVIETIDELSKRRLMYDRNTLLKISNSPLCRKPDLDCKEIIETQSMKNYHIVIGLKAPKTFVRSEHGYIPPNLRLKDVCSQNQDLEKLRRNFKSILNKIAPQNFDTCFSNIKKMITDTDWAKINVKDCMDCLIEEIFDKAVQEEAYSVTYANVCTKIISYESNQETKWDFKTSLLKRCKDMFETPLQDQLKSVREHWEKRTNDETNEQLKNLYKSDIEEQVKKAKDKYFGNIRFIGELYLHDLLKPNIIHICVTALKSKVNDEDALFSLCKLLETVGKKFDDNFPDKISEYIKIISEISETEELSTRIRFRLYDIIEMSKRNWELRQIQVQKMIQPKTLDQVKKDGLDEKNLEASKLANKTQIRMNKRSNNTGEIKFKPQPNKMQSLEINSLQMQPNANIQLKPSYGLWKSGSGVKDSEWTNVEGSKKNTRYGKNSSKYSMQNNKYSPVASRDESPSKMDIGGRFALLQLDDFDNTLDRKEHPLLDRDQASEYEKSHTEIASSSSTREQSPINLEYINTKTLDSESIFNMLLDSNHLDVESWCHLTDISQTVANWIDWIMEKSKVTRNMVGDEFAKLLTDGKLSIMDLVDGIKKFSEDIDDLKTDIPLIWTFLAEFLERLIVDSKSDINFYKVIIDCPASRIDVGNCLAMCLKFADDRLGHDIIKSIMKTCTWSFSNVVDNEHEFLRSKELNFLLEDVIPVDDYNFDKYKDRLISLLPNDDEEVNQFLIDNFGLELTQTEKCVYFVSQCVFTYLSDLPATDITNFLCTRKLFFCRLLDRRSEFEKQTLDALSDSFYLFKEAGIMAVLNGLSDNIISYDAFQQFIQRDQPDDTESSNNTVTLDSTNRRLVSDVYRSMLENSKRYC